MEQQQQQSPPVALRQPNKRISYYYDPDVGNFNYGLGHPMKPHRMRMAHNLIVNYGLTQHMDILRPKRATPEQMTRFHTDEYVDFLQRVTPETVEELTGYGQRYLIGEDCPAFEGLFEFCTISAGGSIGAANRLNSGEADIAINWSGGLHHAKKREASGFCYINDIVLAILELLRQHHRVLYIDIDVHHGDGVEEAFYTTDRVMTCSFHKAGEFFFPGTGDVRDIGMKRGKNYAVNVPMRDGMDDESYKSIFQPIVRHIMEWYRPAAVVLQCGADSLAGDKLGNFNLSMRGHAECVRFVKSFNIPTLCLGGGGYTVRNVARTWTYETSILTGQHVEADLPFNEYLQYFGPEYRLDVPNNNMDNLNTRQYLEDIKAKIIDNLRHLPLAPSIQMQETPRDSLNPGEMELSDDEDSDLDDSINQRLRDAHIDRYGPSRVLASSPFSSEESDVAMSDEEDDHRQRSSRRRRDKFSPRPPLWPASDRLALAKSVFTDDYPSMSRADSGSAAESGSGTGSGRGMRFGNGKANGKGKGPAPRKRTFFAARAAASAAEWEAERLAAMGVADGVAENGMGYGLGLAGESGELFLPATVPRSVVQPIDFSHGQSPLLPASAAVGASFGSPRPGAGNGRFASPAGVVLGGNGKENDGRSARRAFGDGTVEPWDPIWLKGRGDFKWPADHPWGSGGASARGDSGNGTLVR